MGYGKNCGPGLELYIRMETFKTASIGISIGVMALYSVSAQAVPESPTKRIQHARELMGGQYKKSVVKNGEKEKRIAPFVKALVQKFIPKGDAKLAVRVSRAILSESQKHNVDPLFLVAMIQNESSFRTKLVGGVGERGLMQIRPSTARWIAELHKIKFKNDDELFDPAMNIRIGVAYLAHLRKSFKREGQLYVSAYNMGPTKVRKLIDDEMKPSVYVSAVMKRYVALYHGLKKKGDLKGRIKEAYERVRQVTAARKVASETEEAAPAQNAETALSIEYYEDGSQNIADAV